MNNAEKLSRLFREHGDTVPVCERVLLFGLLPITRNRGWLWIDESESHWSATLSNGKTSHNRGRGSVIAADFRKDTGERWTMDSCLTGAWQQIISIWPVRNEAEAIAIFDCVGHHIDLAYRYHCKM